MRPGLAPGSSRTESEALTDLTETGAGLSTDDIWALVAVLEHVARRWMTEFMEPGEQSVGAFVRVDQILPRPPASRVVSTATLREVNGRRYVFDVTLHSGTGELLGSGSNERALVTTTR